MGCNFEHTELSINFLWFNDKCAIIKEANDTNPLSQESKLMHVNLKLNLCPSISTISYLKTDTFSKIVSEYSKPENKFTTMNFQGHTTSWSVYDMQ